MSHVFAYSPAPTLLQMSCACATKDMGPGSDSASDVLCLCYQGLGTRFRLCFRCPVPVLPRTRDPAPTVLQMSCACATKDMGPGSDCASDVLCLCYQGHGTLRVTASTGRLG